MDKLIELRDQYYSVWTVPLAKIQWFDHAAERNRADLLAIADGDTDRLRIHILDTCNFTDITSEESGEVLGRVNIADMNEPF